jgi:hypothetical protein
MFLSVRGVGAARLLLNSLIVSPLALPLLLQTCYMLAVLCGHAPIARRMASEAGLHHIIASALPRVRPPARPPAACSSARVRKHAAQTCYLEPLGACCRQACRLGDYCQTASRTLAATVLQCMQRASATTCCPVCLPHALLCLATCPFCPPAFLFSCPPAPSCPPACRSTTLWLST